MMAYGRWAKRVMDLMPSAISPQPISPPEPHLFGVRRRRFLVRFALARREPVSILQHAHHSLHLFAVLLRRVFLRVELVVARQPRRELTLEELHEMRACAVLEKHHVAADEARAVVGDRLHGALELRA